MPSPEINISHVAKLARLDLTQEEEVAYTAQLSQILGHIDQLSSYPLDAEPSAHAMPVFDVVRADVVQPGLTQEQALSNAPLRAMDQFRIPKVVE
ncbi:MAG TPA: Asp-tRNA(Asn)/Glu-tRNA(Gln) amidotransferase subunit GatC [Prosthecobacter sp.]